MKAFLRAGRSREALELTTDARRRFPEDTRLQELLEKARESHALQLLAQSVRALKAEATPENAIRVIDLCRAVGDFSRAFQFAEEARLRHPDHWGVHAALGKLHYYGFTATRKLDDCRTALDYLLKAQELNPGHYSTLILLAITLLRLGEPEEARAVLEDVIAEHPGDERARQLLAHARRLERSGPDSHPGSEVDPALRQAAPGILSEVANSVPGVLGLFLFDSEGDLLESLVNSTEEFPMKDRMDAVQSLLDTSCLESERIGIGQLTSWQANGGDWRIGMHMHQGLSLVGFFDATAPSEELEAACSRALEGSLVA